MIPFSKLDTPSFCCMPIYSKFYQSATFNLWNIYSIFQNLLLQATEPIPARVSVLQSLSISLAVFCRVAAGYKMQVKAAVLKRVQQVKWTALVWTDSIYNMYLSLVCVWSGNGACQSKERVSLNDIQGQTWAVPWQVTNYGGKLCEKA